MDYVLGEIVLLPFQFAIEGFMSCQGQTLTISQNAALYSLIGPIYGGDGKTTFALPNLKGAEPLPGMMYFIVTQGIYPTRQ